LATVLVENKPSQSQVKVRRACNTRRVDVRPDWPDALIQLVRLLARQAAREAVAAQQPSQHKSPELDHE